MFRFRTDHGSFFFSLTERNNRAKKKKKRDKSTWNVKKVDENIRFKTFFCWFLMCLRRCKTLVTWETYEKSNGFPSLRQISITSFSFAFLSHTHTHIFCRLPKLSAPSAPSYRILLAKDISVWAIAYHGVDVMKSASHEQTLSSQRV